MSVRCHSWGWFSSSKETDGSADNPSQRRRDLSTGSVPEFSMDGFRDEKGVRLVESAKNKLAGSNSCGKMLINSSLPAAHRFLPSKKSGQDLLGILVIASKGTPADRLFLTVTQNMLMVNCLKKLNEHEHQIFLEFLLETNSICYQLQSTLERLAEYGRKQQEELLQRQELLQTVHDNLIENSKSILTAQEAFESKTSKHVHSPG
ncbi:hypothetical protein GH714_033136 [Hevea brasiliensis]|uniref:Uncharacterized protein n=1 Tax=Hevea brasiliensis TaxID=3981 RepID=A0A6A6L7A0_HEVBR|nr:hypothetical protein GH714_033136 [Hevea brasiliensis]